MPLQVGFAWKGKKKSWPVYVWGVLVAGAKGLLTTDVMRQDFNKKLFQELLVFSASLTVKPYFVLSSTTTWWIHKRKWKVYSYEPYLTYSSISRQFFFSPVSRFKSTLRNPRCAKIFGKPFIMHSSQWYCDFGVHIPICCVPSYRVGLSLNI